MPISPTFLPLMVVYNLDIFWTGICPIEANSILIANPDAVLPFPIAG
jgi:hypothetical protein